jgi:hypothetical protein
MTTSPGNVYLARHGHLDIEALISNRCGSARLRQRMRNA